MTEIIAAVVVEKPRSELLHIPVASIRENPVALRGVNRNDEDFVQLVDSIRIAGITNPISVYRKDVDKDGVRDGKSFEIIDGLHRYTSALEIGLSEVPAQVLSFDEAQTQRAQIMANLHRVETKPGDYAKALLRILAATPGMTEAELAAQLASSPSTINRFLNLLKLKEPILKLVNEGKIPVHSGWAMSKLDPNDQDAWVDRAINQPTTEFVPAALKFADTAREAKRAGKAAVDEFIPAPTLRKAGDIKAELATPSVGPVLVKATGTKSANDGFALGVAWCLQMDPESVKAKKANWDAQKKKEAEEKAKKDAERAEKKLALENAQKREALVNNAAAEPAAAAK